MARIIVQKFTFLTSNIGFFVIGGMAIQNADVYIGNDNVKYRQKFSKGQQTLTSFINNGNKFLNAIALLYNKDGTPLEKFTLTPKQPFIKLNEHLTLLIQNNLLDIVVYGRRATFEKCSYYEKIAHKLHGRKYALKEYRVSSYLPSS